MSHASITRMFLDTCLDRCLLAEVEVSWAERYRKDVRQQALIIETLALTLRRLVREISRIEDAGNGLPVSGDPGGFRALDDARELLEGFAPWPDEQKGQAGPSPDETEGLEGGSRP